MNLPIIMLHHVCDKSHESLAGWSISKSKFSMLLDSIESKRLQTITLEDIFLNKYTAKHLKRKVILTFDDCPQSLFDFAIPELLKRNMKAVFFIPTAQIGGFNQWDVQEQGFAKTYLMHQENLLYLSASGMEIGSHGHNHSNGKRISETEFLNEIITSKSILEQLLNKKVFSFAYPYGEVPKNAKALLQKAGYRFGLSIYQPFANQFMLRRIGIHKSDNRKSMAFKLSKSYLFLRFLVDPLVSIFKSLKT